MERIDYTEKLRLLNWNSVAKRLERETHISIEFQHQLKDLFLGYVDFEETLFEDYSLKEVFQYLKVSHIAYLQVCLPKIENTLHELCAKQGAKNSSLNILLIFIDKYKTQLVNHIQHEEQVLFGFVENMLNGLYSQKHKNFVLAHFLHTHNDNVILSLDALKNDLMTFDEDLQSNLAFRILFEQLAVFQHDLMIHGLIEDHVFIPKVLDYIQDNHPDLEN